MTGWGTHGHSLYDKAAALAAVLVFALTCIGGKPALAAKQVSDLLPILKNVPGLSDLPVSDIRLSGTSKSAKVTLRGKSARVAAFKVGGVSMGAFMPDNFSLTDVVPIPHGTPIDGISFKDIAFIYVPKGKAKKNVAVSSFPSSVHTALSHAGSHVNLKAGLNLFGEANFASSGAVKKVLQSIGHNRFSIPLNGVFPANLLGHDLKKATKKIKSDLIAGLNLTLPLPKNLSIPGLPNIVSVKSAQVIIVGREIKGTPKIFAGITGNFGIKIHNTEKTFSFGMLAAQPGKTFKAEITGDSKDTVHLPFFKPLDLTDMHVVANKKDGKWDVVVNAKAMLNSKTVDVAVTHDPKTGNSATIKGPILLSDLLPGGVSIPGVTTVEFDKLEVNKEFFEVTGIVKKINAVVAVFKRNGKTFVAINTPEDLKLSNLISKAKGTPIDAATLQHMNYIWVPKGGARKNVALTDFPHDISSQLGDVVSKVDLKEGLNIVGQLAISQSSDIGKLLKAVKVYKTKYPLVGTLSPKMFKAGGTTQIKNEILDALDLKVALAKIPGLPSSVNISHTNLEIKTVKKGNVRAIDAIVTGELKAKMNSHSVVFDYDVDIVKQAGKPSVVTIRGETAPGTKLSFKMVETFSLSSMTFNMKKQNAKWAWTVDADTTMKNKPLDVTYVHNSNTDKYLQVTTALTLADVVLNPGLPGLDKVVFDRFEIWNNRMVMDVQVKKLASQIVVMKPQGSTKQIIAWAPASTVASLSPAHFIPGAGSSPLKDTSFKNLALVYSRDTIPVKLEAAQTPPAIYIPVNKAKVGMKIQPGLNVFGHLDIHPTGEMAKLLKKVGVTDVNLPLNGGFSPKVFSKNISGTAIKNAILDKLDLKINLPALKIPEVDKFLTFNNGQLRIKGKTPAGVRGIDVAVSGDADFKVKSDTVAFKIDIGYDKTSTTSELSFTGTSADHWTHPLGIKALDLDALTLSIDKKTAPSATSSLNVDVTAKAKVGAKSNLDVSIDVAEKNGSIDSVVFNLTGPLKLSDIPDVKNIPHASHFTIDTIKITEHGIEAKTDFGGKKDLDIFLFDSSGWNLIVRQDNFKITEIVTPLAKTPLKYITLSEAALVVSKNGLTGALSSFGTIAQNGLADIYGASASNIDVGKGLSLIAAFEKSKAQGGVSAALDRIGLTDDRVVLTGDIGGIFGGPPKISVKVALDSPTTAKKQPSYVKTNNSVNGVFSLMASETAGQFDIEIGIGTDISSTVHGTKLLFDAKTALVFEDEKVEIKIFADLKDKKGWKKPFGIPGFTLHEVGMDVGIDEDGAIHLGFDGNIKVNGETFKIATDADLLPEALGFPQDIAFKGSASKVDMYFMEAIAIDMIGADFKLGLPAGIMPTFTNPTFAFVTPGAQDPDLHITGEGFAMSGGMNWLNHDVGSMGVSIGPTSGIKAHGKIDNLNLGPLHLKNNDFKMDIGPKAVPSLTVDADVKVLGIKDKFHFDFNKKGIAIAATSDFGALFKFNIKADVAGKNLTKGSSIKNADIFLDASLSSDPGAWLRNLGGASVKAKLDSIDTGAEKATAALNIAQGKVTLIGGKVTAMKAKVNAEKKADEAKITAAIGKVNSIKKKINGFASDMSRYKSEIHTCNQDKRICVLWKPHFGSCGHRIWGHCIWRHITMRCDKHENIPNIPARIQCAADNIKPRAEYYFAATEKKGAEIAKKGADWALSEARSAVEIIPTDLDPRVAALIVEEKGANLALTLAKDALSGVTAFTTAIEKGVSVFKDTPNLFAVKNSSIRGDLKKALKGQPVVLDMNAEIAGKALEQRLAFSLTDPKFDAEQFGLIALGIAVETVIKEAEKIKIIPTFLLNDVRHLYTNEKNRIDAIIATAVAANNITGKPAVVDGPAAALDQQITNQNTAAAKVTTQNDAALTALEKKHKADLDKFCSVPTSNLRQERPIFDPCFYLRHNPDLIKAFHTDFNKAAAHWVQHGISEGRAASADFSLVAYVLRYPDLSKAFIKNGKIDFTSAMGHWLSNGRKEGLNPKPFVCKATGGAAGMENATFDPCFYLNTYPDLKAAFHTNHTQATEHWLTYGLYEGRQSSVGFDIADYIIRNEDLFKAFVKAGSVDFAGAMDHWVTNGRKEGRNPKPFPACENTGGISSLSTATFDPCFYVNKYADLKSAFGHDSAKALVHWSEFGLKAGRQSSAGFDINAYVVRYPDLEKVFIHSKVVTTPKVTFRKVGFVEIPVLTEQKSFTPNRYADYDSALTHWRQHGQKEGRSPKPFIGCGTTGGVPELSKAVFDPCFYLNKYADLKKAFGTRQELATSHWFAKGYSEGRQASEGFDLSSYMLRYPDLAKAFINADKVDYIGAWNHWATHGQKEGLNPAPLGACGTTGGIARLAKAEFDPCFYLNKYADLKTAFGDKWAYAAQHWIYHGRSEGRQSSAGFYIRDYMLRYDDLRRAFMKPFPKAGTNALLRAVYKAAAEEGHKSDLVIDYTAAYNHWITSGKKEGRNPAPLAVCGATGGIAELRNNVLDACFYVNKYADLKKAFGEDLLASAVHWMNFGYRESRVSSESFSLAGYLARNPDLQNVFIKRKSINFQGALNHWFANGKKEGRKHQQLNCTGPQGSDTSLKGEVLDPCFYINRYADLKKSFGGNWESAIQHWMFTGINEGRQSSTGFDSSSYVMRYDDLRKVFANVNTGKINYSGALGHWNTNGKKEGLNPRPLNCPASGGAPGLENNVFDPCFYLNKYADLRRAFGRNWGKAAQHWLRNGINGGRQSSAGFDLSSYVMRYDDLRKVFANVNTGKINYSGALGHWNTNGKKEGLNPRPLNCPASGGAPGLENNVFDPCFYLKKYADLRRVFGGNWGKAAQHWLQSGVNEGRQSSAGFSIKAYLNRYPDLKKAFGNNYAEALNHWYKHGKKEGRNPRP